MTKQIYLSGRHGNDKFVLVDDEIFDYLSQWTWYCIPHRYTFYACRGDVVTRFPKYKQRAIWMHREVLGLDINSKVLVDHQDRNGLNNQKYNLRVCTNSQNRRNSKLQENNTSGYKGVCKDGNWYRARVTVDGIRISLGYFPDPKDAARAYDKAAREYYGEFALLNFPLEEYENL